MRKLVAFWFVYAALNNPAMAIYSGPYESLQRCEIGLKHLQALDEPNALGYSAPSVIYTQCYDDSKKNWPSKPITSLREAR